MGSELQLLRAVPLFSTLNDAEYSQLEALVEVIGVLRGTELFKKGDRTDAFYVVARGEVVILLDEAVKIPLSDGEFFGEMGVLNSAPRNASAMASQDSILLRVWKKDFDRVLTMNEAIASKIMGVCLARGRSFAVESAVVPEEQRDVLVFYSPRGGAGTTSIAVNVAARLAQLSGEKVALLDGDLQFGNCHIMMECQPPATFAEVAKGEDRPLTETEMAGLVEELPNGIALVRTPAKTEEADLVKPAHLLGMIEYLHEKYGRVVVDTSCALNERTLALLDAASTVFLVAEPEIVSLTRLLDSLRLLKLAGISEESLQVVLNKVGQGGFSPEIVQTRLEQKIYAALEWDREGSQEALFQGVPLVVQNRESPLAIGMSNLARKYLNPFGASIGRDIDANATKKAGFSLWGLLGGGAAEPGARS